MVKPTQPQSLISGWDAASQCMADLRQSDLDPVDIAWVIAALDDAYESARARLVPSATSGLVQQQALFMKGRR